MSKVHCKAALSLIIGAIILLSSLGVPAPAQAEKTVLKAVTFLPTNREKMKIKGIMLIDRINQLAAERAPGELKVQLIGGPEVIPSSNQPIAVRTGTVDMALTCASFYEGLVPVGDIIMLSQVSLEKERSSGALDYIRSLHEKAGLYALGRMDGTREPFFYVGTTKPVSKPTDLKGLRAGSISLFAEAFSRALGMTFQVMPFGDTYTAMENGVIDVYVNALDTQAALGLSKLKGYTIIDHPVYVDNCLAIVNLAKWKTLSPKLQKIMLDAQAEMEKVAGEKMTKFNANERKKLIDAGVKFVKFSPKDAKAFVDLAYSAQWAKMKAKQPEIAKKLEGMIGQ
jgi:TRAP-type C4-dicarboxylate transport system substrate-binding protein